MPPANPVRLDRHWRRSLLFTLLLVGLVIAGIGADWEFALAALLTCAVGFGFFYLVFPGGMHFGVTVANLLALYACLFVFFREANFADAPRRQSIISLALPVLGFLGACFLRRRRWPELFARAVSANSSTCLASRAGCRARSR